MATFDLRAFVEAPSRRLLERCRKADLQEVAAHFDLVVPKSLPKDALRKFVVDYLEAQELLPPPSETGSRPSSPPVAPEKEVKPEESSSGSPSPDLSPSTSPLSGARLKLRLARLRMEADERALERRLRHEMDLKRLDAETQLKMLEIELRNKKPVPDAASTSSQEPDDSSASHAGFRPDPVTPASSPLRTTPFDVSKCITLLPQFRETEVDGYFLAFERIAATLQWPREVWPLLLTCRLTGKALQVVSALSPTDGADYDKVKSTVLTAYELVPEAYRQRFRFEKPQVNQSYVEYAHLKSVLFEKWCSASHISTLSDLKELILIEEFKRHLPEKLVLYLNEQKVNSFSDAALLADEFSLTHRVREIRTDANRAFRPNVRVTPPSNSEKPECFYCHKRGHVIRDCYSLKLKNRRTGSSPNKDRTEIACCDKTNAEKPSPCFKPFLSEGFVSLPGSESDSEVVILRDTGASLTLIKRSLLPLSENSQAGYSVMLQGIEMGAVSAEMHHIKLTCPLVSGDFLVGVLDELPTKGVDLILGNDAAGGLVVPLPELILEPEDHDSAGPLPACVLTRAQTKKDPDITLRGSVLHPFLSDDTSVADTTAVIKPQVAVNFPISHDVLVTAQRMDKLLVLHSLLITLLLSLTFLFLEPQSVPRFYFFLGILCCAPILAVPDLSRPFKIKVDTSDARPGAVFPQEDANGLDHPVGCFSRKFSPNATQKETLVLNWSLKHFHVYVCSQFTTVVFSDHNPLTFLHRMFNSNQRLMRWALLLQEFNIEVRHKKGTDNMMADALSRCHTD
uniref:CCHC-type domain-containing protein n=2 Tax=Nothobranchius TaxID=28779 RepID=A0A8C6PCY4_NOTFU